MWDGFNKRKFPRVRLRCEVAIRSLDAAPPIVTSTENVGAGGVCIILERELERFDTCRVRLEISEKMPPIECQGRIVWVVPTRELKSRKTRFDTGIEFVGLESEASERLKKLIQSQVPAAPACTGK